jgi:hypothetical protein
MEILFLFEELHRVTQTLDGLRPFSPVEHQESHALMGWDIHANGLHFFAGKCYI